MESTLKEVERLLKSFAAKSENQTVERAKGLTLVVIAKRVGQVASNLEVVATNLQALVDVVGERTQK